MKAQLVYNTKEEPRLLLEFETDEEKTVFGKLADLDLIKVSRDGEGKLTDLAYALAPISDINED